MLRDVDSTFDDSAFVQTENTRKELFTIGLNTKLVCVAFENVNMKNYSEENLPEQKKIVNAWLKSIEDGKSGGMRRFGSGLWRAHSSRAVFLVL